MSDRHREMWDEDADFYDDGGVIRGSHFLNIHYIPGIVPDAGDTKIDKTCRTTFHQA